MSKRLYDVIVSSVLLILLLPCFIVISLLVKLTSSGPVFYKQERLGLNSRPFLIYKFRSMRVDAEDSTGPVLASRVDARVTPIGNFIRRTRLDEIPQLINVLKGDMSLVGPRPEREYFIKVYIKTISSYADRLTVKPGITGLSQVMTDYHDDVSYRLSYDLEYLKSKSLWEDIRIMFLTTRFIIGLGPIKQSNMIHRQSA